jgi:hypothetical protein
MVLPGGAIPCRLLPLFARTARENRSFWSVGRLDLTGRVNKGHLCLGIPWDRTCAASAG